MAARDLPNLGLRAFYNPGDNGWGQAMSLNMLKNSVLTQGGASGVVAALPDPATEGDVVILNEAHADNPNKVAVHDAGAWVYFTPLEGWWMYDRGANVYVSFNGVKWTAFEGGGGSGLPPLEGNAGRVLTVNPEEDDAVWAEAGDAGGAYRIGGFFTVTPGANEVVLMHVATDAFTIPAQLAGSTAKVLGNPTGVTVLTVAVDGAAVGSISVSAAGVPTFAGAGGAVPAGGLVTVTAPAAANGLANMAFTIKGAI